MESSHDLAAEPQSPSGDSHDMFSSLITRYLDIQAQIQDTKARQKEVIQPYVAKVKELADSSAEVEESVLGLIQARGNVVGIDLPDGRTIRVVDAVKRQRMKQQDRRASLQLAVQEKTGVPLTDNDARVALEALRGHKVTVKRLKLKSR
jgi:hypothetical protein